MAEKGAIVYIPHVFCCDDNYKGIEAYGRVLGACLKREDAERLIRVDTVAQYSWENAKMLRDLFGSTLSPNTVGKWTMTGW
jgi:hypothetical protein